MSDGLAAIAEGLSPGMVAALDRLCRAHVYADGRSVQALIRRELVKRTGRVRDELLGEFNIDIPTELGWQVHRLLGRPA